MWEQGHSSAYPRASPAITSNRAPRRRSKHYWSNAISIRAESIASNRWRKCCLRTIDGVHGFKISMRSRPQPPRIVILPPRAGSCRPRVANWSSARLRQWPRWSVTSEKQPAKVPIERNLSASLTQNQVVETPCWFESGQGHQFTVPWLFAVANSARQSGTSRIFCARRCTWCPVTDRVTLGKILGRFFYTGVAHPAADSRHQAR